jgi:hypothetical protein
VNVLLILPTRWLLFDRDGRTRWLDGHPESEDMTADDQLVVDLAGLGLFRATCTLIALPMPDPRLRPGTVLNPLLGVVPWSPIDSPALLAAVAPDVFARMAEDMGAAVTYPPVSVHA